VGPRRADAEPHELKHIKVVDTELLQQPLGRAAYRTAEVADQRSGRDHELVAVARDRLPEWAHHRATRSQVEVVHAAVDRGSDASFVDAVVGGETEPEHRLADRSQLAMGELCHHPSTIALPAVPG